MLLLMADFNRLHKGHIGTAPKSAFKKKSPDNKNTEWGAHVRAQAHGWERLHAAWLGGFAGALHILFYEVLVKDTERSIQGVLHFLNYNVTEEDMKCAMVNKEGIYRRRNKLPEFDPYTADMRRSLHLVQHKVLRMITSYRIRQDKNDE